MSLGGQALPPHASHVPSPSSRPLLLPRLTIGGEVCGPRTQVPARASHGLGAVPADVGLRAGFPCQSDSCPASWFA